MRRALLIALVMACAGPNGSSLAGEHCCAHCGCYDGCHSVCRLVKEEKKVETICWASQCEDFCVPCPSKRGCKNCLEIDCGERPEDECCEWCCPPPRLVWFDWIPGCAKIFTKRKLMKKVVTTKIPSYKWVVEDLCAQCEAKSPSAEPEPGAKIPPPPAAPR